MHQVIYHTKTKSHLWWIIRYWLLVLLILSAPFILSLIQGNKVTIRGTELIVFIFVWLITDSFLRRRLEKLVLDTGSEEWRLYYWSIRGRKQLVLPFKKVQLEVRNNFYARPARLFFVRQGREVFLINPRKDAFTFQTMKTIVADCSRLQVSNYFVDDIL